MQNLAWATACPRHRDRIEEIGQTASDDDRFASGFVGYDFPEFFATTFEMFDPLPPLLREVVGNPFRPMSPLPPAVLAWNDGAVFKLAHAIHDEARFRGMPLLADALEDAGCTDADILAPCRQPGEHVRGCWLLDLILGKD